MTDLADAPVEGSGLDAERSSVVSTLLARFGRHVDPSVISAALVPVEAFEEIDAVAAGARSYGLRRPATDRSIDGFEPSASFVADPDARVDRTLALYRGAFGALWFLVIAAVFLVIPGVAVPALVRYFVDTSLVGGMDASEGTVVLALVAAAIVTYLLSYIEYVILGRLAQRMKVLLEARFVRHLLRLPIPEVERRQAGTLSLEAGSTSRLAHLAAFYVPESMLNVVTVVLFFAVMTAYSWKLSVLTLVLVIAYLALVQLLMRNRGPVDRALLDARVELERFTIQGIESIESIKASSSEHEFRAQWANRQRALRAATSRVNVLGQVIAITAPMFQLLSIGLVIIGGAALVLGGTLTLGTLVAFQGLLAAMMMNLSYVVFAGSSVPELSNRRQRMDRVLAEPEDMELSARSVLVQEPIERGAGSIEVRGLVFGYDRSAPPLIDGLGFSVARGGRIALVGASGSGKSTVAKMVTGQVVPWQGEILFDGVARAAIGGEDLASIVAYVAQETTLFEGTVMENLTMLDDSIPAEAVERAAADACILSEISRRPGGLRSRVDPGGRNMSGGQRQRMAIARALVRDPEIIVLDEATSALDPIVEFEVEQKLRERGITSLVIAHRLSTIRDADEIIVLGAGRVLQRGTHDELVSVPGHYKDLVDG